MKKINIKNFFLTLGLVVLSQVSWGQLKSNGSTGGTLTSESAFLDASGFASSNVQNGKGMVFPRTNLTTFTFKTPTTNALKFPTAYDGMLVYNTGTGNTLTGSVIVAVTPGFYYYSNPGATTNSATGVWTRLASGSFTDATTASNGLTLVGSEVVLGGALTSATTMDQGVFPLSITSTASTPNAFSVDGSTFSIDAFNNRVGIGTLAPNSALTISGSANNASSYDAGAGTTIDFANSNLAFTSASAGAFTLTNLKDGGAYTLAVQGAASGTSVFTASGFTIHLPVYNGSTTASSHTLYTFIVIGTHIYVSYVTGL